MWYFSSPQIVHGEGALSHLGTLTGERACVVTDATLKRLGLLDQVLAALEPGGMQVLVIDSVEPDPSLKTVRAGAQQMLDFAPQWIVALGGGSVIDAAKGMWILYERPDIDAAAINPIETLGLRGKARFVAIPTTSGTGSEATWAIVLTDTDERRKLGLGSREAIPDFAIIDPALVAGLPARLRADTGLDALTHAVEGFTSTYASDFTDGLCLHAAKLVFANLPAAVAGDTAASEHMHNAATLAGLGFGNSMAALAHGMGHSLGGVFHVPHGRAVALFLPYTIEFCVRGGGTRYMELARALDLPAGDEEQAAAGLVKAIRDLERAVGQPLTLQEAGISKEQLEAELGLLVDNAMNDTQTIMATRIASDEELRELFRAAWEGRTVEI